MSPRFVDAAVYTGIALVLTVFFVGFFWTQYDVRQKIKANAAIDKIALETWMTDCAGQRRTIDDCTYQWDRNATLQWIYRGKAVQE